jgi:hypothetical protein
LQRNGGLFGNHVMNGGHRRAEQHQTNATQRPLQVQPPPHYAHMEEQPAGRLGRANAISSAPQLRHSWQVPNGHFMKHRAPASAAGAGQPVSDTDEDDRC